MNLITNAEAKRISTEQDERETRALAASWGFGRAFAGPEGYEKLVANRGR
jgi:hypothetical protein